ncbi:MAG TPA: serine hydrolase [Paludibaculum sp.]|jgi:beta-lactamase class A
MRRRTFVTLSAAVAAPPPPPSDAPILSIIKGFPANISLYARNLDTGQALGIREDQPVRTASTIKLPIMATVFDHFQRGAARPEETLLLREEDKVSGSGVLHELSAGLRLPLLDLVHLMIVVSDNTATNLILDRISADSVNALMDRLDLPHTRSLRKVRGDGDQLKAPSGWSQAGLREDTRKFGLGVSTSREMVALLEKLHRGELVSPQASRQMLAILKRQQLQDGLGRRLGQYTVASKSGSLDALRSDVGIVYTPKGSLALAITVDGLTPTDYSADNPGLLLIARLAEELVRILVFST